MGKKLVGGEGVVAMVYVVILSDHDHLKFGRVEDEDELIGRTWYACLYFV